MSANEESSSEEWSDEESVAEMSEDDNEANLANEDNFAYKLFVVSQNDWTEFPLATTEQVTENTSWKKQMGPWYIATLADGKCDGWGYGHTIVKQTTLNKYSELGHKVIVKYPKDKNEFLVKPTITEPLSFPTHLPTLPPEVWRRIFGFLTPVEQWEIEDTYFQFQSAASFTDDEIIRARHYDYEVDSGLHPNSNLFTPKSTKFSHIFGENSERSKTIGVVHMPNYLKWLNTDVLLESRFLHLETVCWLNFNASIKLPKGNFCAYFKMKRQHERNNIKEEYKISISIADVKVHGFLPTTKMKQLSTKYWTWLPVLEPGYRNEQQMLNFDVEQPNEVIVDLFNNNPMWTSGLAWHAVTFVPRASI